MLEGIGDGAATITAEIKYYVGETLTSFSPAISDTITITGIPVYTVTYNLNGGNIGGVTDAVVETNVVSGTLVGAAYNGGTPVFTGNTWTTPYWVTTAIGDTDAASSPVTADVTVYAYWVTS